MISVFVGTARRGVFCKLQCQPCHYVQNSLYLVMKGRRYAVNYFLETRDSDSSRY